MQAQSLWCLGLLISAGLAQGHTLQYILASFMRIICGAWVDGSRLTRYFR